jgi:hypothetical protein
MAISMFVCTIILFQSEHDCRICLLFSFPRLRGVRLVRCRVACFCIWSLSSWPTECTVGEVTWEWEGGRARHVAQLDRCNMLSARSAVCPEWRQGVDLFSRSRPGLCFRSSGRAGHYISVERGFRKQPFSMYSDAFARCMGYCAVHRL